jgi:hypothetical protein
LGSVERNVASVWSTALRFRPMSYRGSVAWKLHKTLWVLAWVAVALGVVAFLLGWYWYRGDVKSYECVHAKLGTVSTYQLLTANGADPAKRAGWEAWAAQIGAEIHWKYDDSAPSYVRFDACGALLSESSPYLPPDLLRNEGVMLGIKLVFFGLVALGVLRWIRWLITHNEVKPSPPEP